MAARKKSIRKFQLKLSINAWYKWVLAFILILAALLALGNGFLLSSIKEMGLDQTAYNDVFQERELHLSKFYNNVNKDELIRELYSVTGNKRYLGSLRENSDFLRREFDSLKYYCQADEYYCNSLDTLGYFLELYIEMLIPQFELAHHYLNGNSSEAIELARLEIRDRVASMDNMSFQPGDAEGINELLDHNYALLKEEIIRPAGKIGSMDRDRTRSRRNIFAEQISSLNLWQKIISILTLAFVLLLAMVLAYIIVIPLEKPKPLLSRFPDVNYVASYPGFEMEMAELLEKHKDLFLKYKGIVLIFPKEGLFPAEIPRVFRQFCEIQQIPFVQEGELDDGLVRPGQAFVILENTTLAAFVEIIEEKKLIIGKDAGVLSYGDSPLKRLVADGITVIENTRDDCTQPRGRKNRSGAVPCLEFIERASL